MSSERSSSERTERYTFKSSEDTAALMAATRRADFHAAFLLPYLKPTMTALDCGCGPGAITLELAAILKDGSITGIDTDERALDKARIAATQREVSNADFELADIYELPFPDASFDVAYVNALLVHLSDPARALAEVGRFLKPSGLVGVCEPELKNAVLSPREPIVEEMMCRVLPGLFAVNGGDAAHARAVRSLLRTAGFSELTVAGAYEMFAHEKKDILADYLMLFSNPEMQRPLLENGLVSGQFVARGVVF